MQHRRILFLISLPSTKVFETDRAEIDNCLTELEAKSVTVRREVSQDSLADVERFDVVIMVAHYDVEKREFVLHDGVLPMASFIDFLPSHFAGVIDLSVCHSADMVAAIKSRCPGCKVQAALSNVPLLSRIIIYPQVADLFLSGDYLTYADAYNDVSALFGSLLEEQGMVYADYPRMTHLGESVSTIFAPERVVRNNTFQIILFFSYDAEQHVFCFQQTDALMRDKRVTHILLEEDDVIDVLLTFYYPGKDAIEILDGEGRERSFKVGRGTTTMSFIVNVTEAFLFDSFVTQLALSHHGEVLAKLSFNIEVGSSVSRVPAMVSCADSQTEDETALQDVYRKIADSRLMGNTHSDSLGKIRCDMPSRGMVDALRRYMISKDLCYQAVMNKVEECANNLAIYSDRYGAKADIYYNLIYILSHELQLCCSNMDKIKLQFDKKRKCCGDDSFDDMMASFPVIERKYLEVLLKVKDIILQVALLNKLQDLKEALDADDVKKDEIKKKASAIAKCIQDDEMDKVLFGYVQEMCKKTLHANRSGGITKPTLALFISMLKGGGQFIDTDHKCMTDNFMRYMDVGDANGVREVYNILKNLKDRTLNDKLKSYRRTRSGSISVSAYYIQKIIISSK